MERTVQFSSKKRRTKKDKAVEQIEEPVQYPASTDKATKEAIKTATKKIIEKPEESYKKVPEFPDTGKISFLKTKDYMVAVSTKLKPSLIRCFTCMSETSLVPDLIQTDVLETSGRTASGGEKCLKSEQRPTES